MTRKLLLRLLSMALLLMTLAACGPTTASQTPGDSASPRAAASRTMRVGIRVEPTSIAAKSPGLGGGVTLGTTHRLFNANLTIDESNGNALPYLAEAIPQLDTDGWRVFPDGRMETTYRLRPNLVWHDGTPLTAADFVFSWRAYSVPELGVATSAPLNLFEEVVAPDDLTVRIRWLKPWPDANTLAANFPPLPRHILEAPLRDGTPDAFAGHPYWSREFVGLGPYRLTEWEPGAFIEGTAFDRHITGRPKIDRIRITFIGDPNTALANLLAGQLDLAVDTAIQFQGGVTLKRDWGPTGGSIFLAPTLFRQAAFQLRPELANPAAVLDLRVRKALAHSVDKRALNDLLFEGEGLMADSTPLAPGAAYYVEMERAVERFQFDVRRAQQLMAEAGYQRGADGVYAGPQGRLGLQIKTNATSEQEREMAVLAAGWREAGFDFAEVVNPSALAQDNEVRATFPSIFTYSGGGRTESGFAGYNTRSIPSGANRWQGGNRGGWSNADFDRLADALTTSLDRAERDRLVVGMARIFTAELPLIPLHFPPTVMAAVAALRGPLPFTSEGTFSWNAHEWEFKVS